ncbi:MAG: M28 family peptidase, partial [Gemmataceae bacterium]
PLSQFDLTRSPPEALMLRFPPAVRRLAAASLLLALSAGVMFAESPKDNKPADKADAAAADPVALDKKIIADIKANSHVSKNLQHLCDVIGPRLTGSANLKKANEWAAEKMKEYGLTNVKLEPWEIPVGWERGTATMKMIEPNPGKQIPVAANAWTPGTKGKITGEVVFLDARTKDDLAKYKGKLKDALILSRAPSNVAPVTDLSYLGSRPQAQQPAQPPKEEPKKEEKKDEVKKEETKKDEPNAGEQPPAQPPAAQPPAGGRGGFGGDFMAFRRELSAFLRAEGAAVMLSDSAKPHGLIVTNGSWPSEARDGNRPPEPMPSLSLAHETYAMLYRLATSKDGPKPKVEVEITNTFIPGPITVYNTVGEIVGGEKPDEFVVIGAHLDSWDLGTGATDNGTGSCTVLEVARTLGALAKQGIRPKRTVRFVLFTGEEQGLHGSKQYVARHKDEMAKTSACLVHDTGTGKVLGLAMQGRTKVRDVLEPELVSLKEVDGWKGLNMRNQGGTDHLSFDSVGVPGFACDQDTDEYRLTHHTQTDTYDHVKIPNIIQGAQVMSVAVMRIANLPDMLPRERQPRTGGGGRGGPGGPPPAEEVKKDEVKKEEVKKDDKKEEKKDK